MSEYNLAVINSAMSS